MKKYSRKTSNIKRKLNKTAKRTKKISKKVGGAVYKNEFAIEDEVDKLYEDLVMWISDPENRKAAHADPLTPKDFDKVTAKYGGIPNYNYSNYAVDPEQYNRTRDSVINKFAAKGDLHNLPRWSKNIIVSTIVFEALLRP